MTLQPALTESSKTWLEIIDECDSFPYTFPAKVTPEHRISRFFVKGELIGYLRHSVVEALRLDFPAYFDLLPNEGGAFDVFVRDRIPSSGPSSPAASGPRQQDNITTTEEVTKLLNGVASFWRTRGTFDVLQGWRNEQYTVYSARRSVLFTLERSACSLFGVVTYGAHLNVYVQSPEGIEVWIPRRSQSKPTFPGKLDNSVAGGISNGLSPRETIIKEALEEASIPEDIAKGVKATGCISYMYVDGSVDSGSGWIQPEVQYTFDLLLQSPHEDFQVEPDGQ